jgi:hypothetical protein
MPLLSPRFTSSDTLIAVERNTTVLQRGSKGRDVHLVQMALIDLGYAMPISTASDRESPDGIYGDETFRVVEKFQHDTPDLAKDGIVGQKTIRKLDEKFAGFQHRVNLHFRSIALTSTPFDRLLSSAKTAYGQYGIAIEMGNGESLALCEADQALFDQIDQECNWLIDDGEIKRLHSLGTPAPQTDVLVYFVRRFSDASLTGCGGSGANRPACTIAAFGNRWTMAHEVGHVLLGSSFSPVHSTLSHNLMFGSTKSEAIIPILTDRQVKQMRASICCKTV